MSRILSNYSTATIQVQLEQRPTHNNCSARIQFSLQQVLKEKRMSFYDRSHMPSFQTQVTVARFEFR